MKISKSLRFALVLVILAFVFPAFDSRVLGQSLPTLSVDNPSFNEDAGNGYFTVSLDAPAQADTFVSASLNMGEGTATYPDEFSLSPGGGVTILVGQSSAQFSFEIFDDPFAEWNETFIVTFSLGEQQLVRAATIIDDDGIPVNAPSDLAASSLSFTEIKLSWVNHHTNATENQIERSPNGTSGWEIIANLTPDTTQYLDDTAECSKSYHYRVRAVGEFVYSDYSNTASATTDDCSTPGVAPQQNYFTTNEALLTWNSITSADSYELRVDTNPDFTNAQTITGLSSPSVILASLQNTVYYWQVRAVVNGAGGLWSGRQIFVVDARELGPPPIP